MFRGTGYALNFLSSHGEAADEFNEAFAVALRWNRGDLRFVMRETFPDVLCFLYETVLWRLLATVWTGPLDELACVRQSMMPK